MKSSIYNILVFSTALFFLTGCSGGNGGNIINNGDGSFSLSLSLNDPNFYVLEGGESVLLSITLKDGYGRNMQGQSVRFRVIDPDDSLHIVGRVSQAEATTDTLQIGGTTPGIRFISTDYGRALVLGEYYDGAGNILDTAAIILDIVTSMHIVDMNTTSTTIVVNQPTEISCFVIRGTQDNPFLQSGLEVILECYQPGSPPSPFGVILPSSIGVTDSLGTDGLMGTEPFTFFSDTPGLAMLRATYRNGLGDIASVDSVMVTVEE